MANERGGWDTSTAHIRRTLRQCIELGREAQGKEGPTLFEAYRLLGSGLHTLEGTVFLLVVLKYCQPAHRSARSQVSTLHPPSKYETNTS